MVPLPGKEWVFSPPRVCPGEPSLSLLPSFLASSPSALLSQAFVLSPFITKPPEILRIASPLSCSTTARLQEPRAGTTKQPQRVGDFCSVLRRAPPLSSPPGKVCQASFSRLPSPSSFSSSSYPFSSTSPSSISFSLSLPPPLSLILPPLYSSSSTFSSSSLNLVRDVEQVPLAGGGSAEVCGACGGCGGCRGPERTES